MKSNSGNNKTILVIILILLTLLVSLLVYTFLPGTSPLEVVEEKLIPELQPSVKAEDSGIKNPDDGEDPKPSSPEKPDGEKPSELPEVIEARNKAIELLRTNFIEKYKVSNEDWMLSLKYLGDIEGVWTKEFTLRKVPQLGKIASFGITLLSGYANDNKVDGYLRVVEDLIKRVDAELKKTAFGKQKTPWNQDWYDVSVLLMRMLATYEFLGNKDEIKEICHRRIGEITPKLNESLGWRRNGIELMWIAVPRLITNKLYDVDKYNAEVNAESFKMLGDVVAGAETKNDGGIRNGIYSDRSCIYNKVATYWSLVTSGEFYSSVLRALELETGIEDKTKKIFNEILHPSMNFVPYGMFGRDTEVTCTRVLAQHWPSYNKSNADLKVHICPLIGFGVFKSEKFAFWVRVQRKDLAAYVSDQTHFNLAAGWIQMRKLYLTDVKYDYDDGMEWPKLETQPGVISYADVDDFDILKPGPGEMVKRHYAEALHHDFDCHIGHFENENKRVLYWVNKYKFKLYGETKITEFGVCTDNGLVMRHEIHNRSGKTLTIRTKDLDIGARMFFECKTSTSDYPDGIVTINNNAEVVVNWRLVLNAEEAPRDVTLDATGQHMAFTFGDNGYVIESKKDNHFVFENTKPILAGSPGIFTTYPIFYDLNTAFKYVEATRMYRSI